MTSRELREYIPFIFVKDGCVFSKRGDMTFGWKVWLPVAYTVNEAGYDSIISSFLQAYKLLPPYTIVHKQDIFKFDTYHARPVGEFLGDAYEKHFEGRRFLNGYCYIYLTFSSKSVIENKSGKSGFFGILDTKIPKEDAVEQNFAIASQFESVLGNSPFIKLTALTSDDFLSLEHGQDKGVIPDYLRLFEETPAMDYPMEFSKDKIVIGDNEVRCWYIEDSDAMPSQLQSAHVVRGMSSEHSLVFLSGGAAFGYQLEIPHIVNRYVVSLPRNSVEKELEQKKRLMNSFSLYSSGCRINAGELDDYLEANARDAATTIKCFTDVIAWGRPSEIPGIRDKVITAFSNLDITVSEDRLTAPLLHYAGIPGAAGELGYDCYMTSEMNGYLCLDLWDGYDHGMEGGCIKLNDRNRMVPVTIDLQSVARSKGYVDNMNALVVGPSGSGKSFTMNTLVRNYYNTGQHILIIDVGDSYQGICQVIYEETKGRDGVYNSYDPDHPFSFNPFRGRSKWNDKDEDGENSNSGSDFIMSLLETMFQPERGWTKQATGILAALIGHFFKVWDEGYTEELERDLLSAFLIARRKRCNKEHKPFDEEKERRRWVNPLPKIFDREGRGLDPIFDDFYQFVTLVLGPLIKDENYRIDNSDITPAMFDIDGFGVALSKYKIGGEFGFLLNAEQEADLFNSRLTVFEVDKIKDNKDLFPLWILCIMHSFEDKMRSLPCQKVMIIEEAWKAISVDTMANFIVWMWRTARKFRTSAVVVTQSIGDLLSSEIVKDAIIQNSAVKILLDQRKNANNFENSIQALGLKPMDVALVLSVGRSLNPNYRYKEAFIAIGERYSNVFGIEVSEEEALAYESDKTLKKPVFDLAAKKGSLIEAIREMAEEMRRKS